MGEMRGQGTTTSYSHKRLSLVRSEARAIDTTARQSQWHQRHIEENRKPSRRESQKELNTIYTHERFSYLSVRPGKLSVRRWQPQVGVCCRFIFFFCEAVLLQLQLRIITHRPRNSKRAHVRTSTSWRKIWLKTVYGSWWLRCNSVWIEAILKSPRNLYRITRMYKYYVISLGSTTWGLN